MCWLCANVCWHCVSSPNYVDSLQSFFSQIIISISIVMIIIKMIVMIIIGGMVIICRRICGGAEVASTGITNSSDHSHRELLSSSSRSSSSSSSTSTSVVWKCCPKNSIYEIVGAEKGNKWREKGEEEVWVEGREGQCTGVSALAHPLHCGQDSSTLVLL